MPLVFEIEVPTGYETFHLPKSLNRRLQTLLDQQDTTGVLTSDERGEAQELVELAEWLSLMRLKAKRLADTNGTNP